MVKSLSLLSALVLFNAFLAAPAFASKARLLSLGQSANGSPYIEDTRQIFLNPALLNRQSDFANFEFGSSNVKTTPNAEGGFFHALGNFKFGLQLGRTTDMTQ